MSIPRLSRALCWSVFAVSACSSELPAATSNPATMEPSAPAVAGSTAAPPSTMSTAGAPARMPPAAAGSGTSTAGRSSVGSAGAGPAGDVGPAAGSGAASSVAGSVASAAGAPAQPAAGAASPVAGTSGGAAGMASAAGSAAPPHEDLGKGDGRDVITIGDSWMNYAVNGGGIEAGLRTASGQAYRNYGVAGTMLLDEVIPNQYEAAKRADPDIKTVVMTGGGNDLLLTGMTAGGCTGGCMMTIDQVGARLEKLWKEMGADGVKDIVYIEYSRGGSNAPGVNYGTQQIKPICAAVSPARCHFVDSDPVIMMQLLDGVHPTPDGCQKLGKAVFDLMVQEGMRR